MAKFANDAVSRKSNAYVKKIVIEDKPHLLLFSKKTIGVGEEIRYDYGVPTAPWRKKVIVTRTRCLTGGHSWFFSQICDLESNRSIQPPTFITVEILTQNWKRSQMFVSV